MENELSLVHDDGGSEITIVVHGYAALASTADADQLVAFLGSAELRGKVYLCSWHSGGLPRLSPLSVGTAVASLHPAGFVVALLAVAANHFGGCQQEAEAVGEAVGENGTELR